MKTPRLFSATAAVAVGLALLSSGGGSVAGWYDELEIPGATITSGELRVEKLSTSVTTSGSTVIVDVTSRLHVEGDALAAGLTLNVEGLSSPDGSQPVVEVRKGENGERLDLSAQPWQVDDSDDGVMVTAHISLPIAAAQALTGQPKVTWKLTQATPGQGWSSEAVQEISFAGVLPAVPIFPSLACALTSVDGVITISWTSNDPAPTRWEVVEHNGAGNKETIVETITSSNGVMVYSATVDTQNGIWRYSIRAVYEGEEPQLSQVVTLTSCAAGTQNGG
ncbi:hypothetical protein [Georgenia daeguensis]|uniref:Fibronectin type-III domain-containing protein n=1 Tax=Georgenia daeguensis TaxID=908355 RepID=A0ABP8ESL0_9MICO